MRVLATLCVLGMLLMTAGCGESSTSSSVSDRSATPEQAAALAVVREYDDDAVSADGKGICQLYTAEAKRKLLDEAKAIAGAGCGAVLDAALSSLSEARIDKVEREVSELTVADVVIHGDTASLSAHAGVGIELEEVAGQWRVRGTGEP